MLCHIFWLLVLNESLDILDIYIYCRPLPISKHQPCSLPWSTYLDGCYSSGSKSCKWVRARPSWRVATVDVRSLQADFMTEACTCCTSMCCCMEKTYIHTCIYIYIYWLYMHQVEYHIYGNYNSLLVYHTDLRFRDASLPLADIVTHWCQAFLTYENMKDEDGDSEESEDEEHQIMIFKMCSNSMETDCLQVHVLSGKQNALLRVIPTITYVSEILSCTMFGIYILHSICHSFSHSIWDHVNNVWHSYSDVFYLTDILSDIISWQSIWHL